MLPNEVKCGYCGWMVDTNQILRHYCFSTFDSGSQMFTMDEAGVVFIENAVVNDISTVSNKHHEIEKENRVSNNVQRGDDSLISETSGVSIREHEIANEAINDCDDIHQADELLISLVQERPALYDHRISALQRTKLKKKELWQQISNDLQGVYSGDDAEKRWKYLRECYAKDRRKVNMTKKKSGAASTSKNEETKSSFRFYKVMHFLNDILEHKETITSLKFPKKNSLPQTITSSSTSKSNSPVSRYDESYMNIEDESFSLSPPVTECRTPSMSHIATPSRSLSAPPATVSRASITSNEFTAPVPLSRKRKSYGNVDEYDKVLLEALCNNTQPDPIDGFMLRLAEGMRRLSYERRSRLEMEFFQQLQEAEAIERMERPNE